MIILGFDTSTPATAVALVRADGEVLEARDDPPPGGRPAHATRLLPLADELLTRASLPWRAVQRIAVGVGPGSFTGLRIGVASARGLAQSLGVELAGVSSLRALAAGAAREAAGRPVLAVVDARRGEVYAGAYLGDRELAPPRAVAPDHLSEVRAQARGATPSDSWLGVGDGAIRFRSQLQTAGVAVPAGGAGVHRVSAAIICRLAAGVPPLAPEAVVPDYRRRPDAEIARTTLPSSRQ